MNSSKEPMNVLGWQLTPNCSTNQLQQYLQNGLTREAQTQTLSFLRLKNKPIYFFFLYFECVKAKRSIKT
jgi:hypothetical protein